MSAKQIDPQAEMVYHVLDGSPPFDIESLEYAATTANEECLEWLADEYCDFRATWPEFFKSEPPNFKEFAWILHVGRKER